MYSYVPVVCIHGLLRKDQHGCLYTWFVYLYTWFVKERSVMVVCIHGLLRKDQPWLFVYMVCYMVC